MAPVNEELRAKAQQVVYEALEIETGGLGPNTNRESSGEYLSRCAAAVVRHLDLAEYLKDPQAGTIGPGTISMGPKPRKPAAKK